MLTMQFSIYIFRFVDFLNSERTVLFVWVLENHVFLDTRIDRSIAARDVLNSTKEPARLFHVPQAKQFLHRRTSSKAIGTKSQTLAGISRSGRLKPRAARGHQDYDKVEQSVLNEDAHVAQTAALVIGNNNMTLCSFARLLQAYRLLGVGAEICWHLGLWG